MRSNRNWKTQLGLPPRRGIGSPENKKVRRKIEQRWKQNQLRVFLEMRGRIPRGGIPKMPDARVEASETNTVSCLTRCEQSGKLQIVPRRRKLRHADQDKEERELGKVVGVVERKFSRSGEGVQMTKLLLTLTTLICI